MTKKTLCALLLAGVAVLSGCTSMAERRVQQKQYDDSLSYAMNVTRQFWQPRFKDTPAPRGVAVSDSTLGADIALSAISWASGPSLISGGFGLDLGMSILGDLSKDTPLDMQPHVLAFVDAAKFPDRKDAELEAVTQVYQAALKALKELNFVTDGTVEPAHTKVLWQHHVYAGANFDNKDLGCMPRSALPNQDDWEGKVCWFDVRFRAQDDDDYPAAQIPTWMPNGGHMGWPMFEKATLVWNLSSSMKVSKEKFFVTTAKYLPDGYWLYMEPKKAEGSKGYSAPFLLDNKGIHFFVIESAKAAAK